MQKIGRAGCKASIFAISVLFVDNIHLLSENVLIFIETTTLKDDEILVKTSFFRDKIVFITRENKAEIDSILAILYNTNMQIRKKKSLNTY